MLQRMLGLVFWIGAALVGAAFAIRFGYPRWEQYATYLAWGGLACVVLYTLGQWREIVKIFGHRQARYGTLAGTSVLVVLGIIVAANYIGAKQNKRWDLTANKTFTLSDQSRNTVSKLDAPLQIQVFVQDDKAQGFQDRLKEYAYASSNVKVEYIDPDKQPTIAEQNQIKQYGTIVFNYKGRTERVSSDTEQDITNAIIKVVTGQQKKVYFTLGHGERDTAGTERDGYGTIAAALKGENYTVGTVVLAQQGSVPADADVVVVAGPKIDFLPPEVDALKQYLGKAGKLLLALDPPAKVDSPPLTNLVALAHDWGMEVGNDIVIDLSGMGRLLGTSEAVPVVLDYASHAIAQRFGFMTGFPLVRSVTPVPDGVSGHTAQPFARTSEQAFAVTDLKTLLAGQKKGVDESKGDKKGPITIASAVSAPATPSPAAPAAPPPDAEAPKPETRVVAIGDSDFAANNGLGIQGNRDFFMNIVGWLSQQENLISIRPKEPDDRRLTMTATQQANLTWLSWVVIPGGIFMAGVFTWWRRR